MRMHTAPSRPQTIFSHSNLSNSATLRKITIENAGMARGRSPKGRQIAILTWDDTLDAKECAFAIADSMNHFSATHLFNTKIFLAHQHDQDIGYHSSLEPTTPLLPLAISEALSGFDYLIMLIDQHAIDNFSHIIERYIDIGQSYHNKNNSIIVVDCTEQTNMQSEIEDVFTNMKIPFIKPPLMLSIALGSKALRLPALALLGGWVLEK